MEYLTVGTNEITKDLFIPIKDKDTDSTKPSGGLWLTQYDRKYNNYNEWVDFLINNPTIFFYKNRTSNIWQQPCSLVTLKDDCNLFNLNNSKDINYLITNYPLNNKKFSYELLKKEYDGIYVDIMQLIKDRDYDTNKKYIKDFSVSSLILFNLDCIDYYNSGYVLIEPFDFEYYMYETTGYQIIHEKIKKKIR